MESSSDQHPVEALAEEFLAQKRRGANPTIQEYCDRYPEWAEDIADIFPAMELMEDFKPDSEDLADSLDDGSPTIPELEQVADYRILKEIGRGGMGVVYEAEQQSLGRRVALKVLPRQTAGDSKALARFQREARAAAKMHHTNIVPVFEVGQDKDHVFYAMQLIQGQGLDFVIGDLKQLRSDSIAGNPSAHHANGEAAAAPARSLAASLVLGEFQEQRLLADSDADITSQPNTNLTGHQTVSDRPTTDPDPALVQTVVTASSSTATAVLPGQSELSTAESNRRAFFLSVAEIGLQTARALSYAHARGIIHRDIKPSNLLLDTTGVVWITDFGLAKTSDTALTHTGDILGTIRYMSPERFKGQCDVRADIYSLGLTLYELLLLKPAFESPDRLKLIDMIGKAAPPAMRAADSRIPRDLETIVLKAADKDPRRRYQSADEMVDDLQHFINDEPIRARRASAVERVIRWGRRNPWLATAMSVAGMALVAVTVVSGFAATQQAQAAEDQSRLNGRLIQANDDQKKLVEELQAVSDEQQKTNEALTETNRTNAELIRDLKKSQSRLAEKQAEFVKEKGNVAESMLWLARSYELADGQAPEFRRNLLTKLEAVAARMPRLVGVADIGKSKLSTSLGEQLRDRILNAPVGERLKIFQEFRDSTAFLARNISPVLSDDQTLIAVPALVEAESSEGSDREIGIKVWDVRSASWTGMEIRPKAQVRELGIDSSRRLIATTVWQANEEVREASSESDSTEQASSRRIRPRVGSMRLKIWSIDTGELLVNRQIATAVEFTSRRPPQYHRSLLFRRDGSELVILNGSGSDGVEIAIHSVGSGELIRVSKILSERATRFTPLLSPDGERLVCWIRESSQGTRNSVLERYDVDTGEQIGDVIETTLPERILFRPPALLTPDGSRVAITSRNGRSQRIQILDFETGGTIGSSIDVPHAASDSLSPLNADPTGRQLAVAIVKSGNVGVARPLSSLPDAVQVFDTSSGEAVTPPLPTSARTAVLAMPTGEDVLSVVSDRIQTWQLPQSRVHRTLIPWGSPTATDSRTLNAPSSFLNRMNRALAVAHGTQWSSIPAAPGLEISVHDEGHVLVAEETPDGVSISTWDSEAGRLLSRSKLPQTQSSIVGMFSPGGKYLLTGGVGEESEPKQILQIWHVDSGTRFGDPLRLSGDAFNESPLAISPDGSSVLLRRRGPNQQSPLRTEQSDAPRRGFGRERFRVAIVVVSMETGEEISLPESPFPNGGFSADGRYVLVDTPAGQQRFDLETRKFDSPLPAPVGTLAERARRGSRGGFGRRARFGARNHDRTMIAAIAADSLVQIRPLRTNGGPVNEVDELVELPHPAQVEKVMFDPDGERVITAAADGLIRQWYLPKRWTGTAEEIRQRVELHVGLALSETDDVVVTDDHHIGRTDESLARDSSGTQYSAGDSIGMKFLTDDEHNAIRMKHEERWEAAVEAFAEWSSERPNDWQPVVLSIHPLVELQRFEDADAAWNLTTRLLGRDAAFAWLQAESHRVFEVTDDQVSGSSSDARYNRFDEDTAGIQGWYLKRLVEFAPSDTKKAASLFQIAKVHEVGYEFDKAAEAIDKAVALEPDSKDMHYYRAHLMERLSRWDEAIESREARLRLSPEASLHRYQVVASCLFSGDLKTARQRWDEFFKRNKAAVNVTDDKEVERNPAGQMIRDQFAKLRLVMGGDDAESLQLVVAVANANFTDQNVTTSLAPFVRQVKGLAEFRLGTEENYRAAISHLDAAAEQFNVDNKRREIPLCRFFTAMAHFHLGEAEAAEREFLDGLDHQLRSLSTWQSSQIGTAATWQLAEVARREAVELLGIDESQIDPPITDTSNWKVLFEANFDEEIDEKWQQVDGEWSVVEGAASATLVGPEGATTSGYARFDRDFPDLPDTFEIEYETWASAPMLASCFLRQSSEDDELTGHRIALCSAPDRELVKRNHPATGVSLMTLPDWKRGGLWFPKLNSEYQFQPNQHYNVRIVRQPQRITVFVDDGSGVKQVLSSRVRNISTSAIRFFSRGEPGAKVFVDNFTIRVPKPE